MVLKQFQFNDIIAYYRSIDKPLNNLQIAKTLNISERSFYRYKRGEIPSEDIITSVKRKVVIRHRYLNKVKNINSPKIETNYKILSTTESHRLKPKTILKRKRIAKDKFISKKIQTVEEVIDYLIYAECNCNTTSLGKIKHKFRAYMDRLRSDKTILDFMIIRHNDNWFGHELLNIEIITITEVPSPLVSIMPFKDNKVNVIRSDRFSRNLLSPSGLTGDQ